MKFLGPGDCHGESERILGLSQHKDPIMWQIVAQKKIILKYRKKYKASTYTVEIIFQSCVFVQYS